MISVEVCAEGLAAALAAGDGGADRVELCSWRGAGGVTPSAGAVTVACRRLAIPVHVLIRPRAGDFVYDLAEREEMAHDVAAARDAGAAAVVLGVLNRDGTIDGRAVARLAAIARPMSVTFHKAFDATPDLHAALETLVDLGVDRVLTSGGRATAREGVAMLAELVRHAGDRLAVLAGGSIARPDIPALVDAGLAELHIGSAACNAGGGTDPEAVRTFVGLLRRHEARRG
jgi:copper homeostasis protein